MIEHDPLIGEYEHEKSRPREAEALQTLKKVASLVKPIMRQRGWRVGILTEFFPAEHNLLGLNWDHGRKICLRLRYPHDERQFLPMEQIVDTMLHELCHNVHGPHNEAFNTLWNQLRSEHEQLTRKGYTGEGFLSQGRKLGGGRRIPMHEAQRLARAAAEKRKILNAGSGQKLGGAPVAWGQDIRRVIADAASRRITVTQGCASGTERSRGIVEETSKKGFRTKAEEDDANEEAIMLAYIDLIQEEEREKYGDQYIPASKDNPAGSQGARLPSASASSSSSTAQIPKAQPPPSSSQPPPRRFPESSTSSSSSTAPPLIDLTTSSSPSHSPPPPSHSFPTSSSSSEIETWTCKICTLINSPHSSSCDACSTPRPTPPSHPSRPFNPTQIKPNNNNNNNSAIKSLTAMSKAAEKAPAKPLGWLCHVCGTWMESEWWTCAGCGGMKLSS